jgi:hypothetical protein
MHALLLVRTHTQLNHVAYKHELFFSFFFPALSSPRQQTGSI